MPQRRGPRKSALVIECPYCVLEDCHLHGPVIVNPETWLDYCRLAEELLGLREPDA